MPVDKKTVSCGECKVPLEEDPNLQTNERTPCPNCGSLVRIFHVHIHNTVSIKSKLGMKARRDSGGKPFVEQISGDDLHRKTGNWMKLKRIIDRENDHYHEIVTDPLTGEIVHECEERLSDHKGHGSAKYKNKKKNG